MDSRGRRSLNWHEDKAVKDKLKVCWSAMQEAQRHSQPAACFIWWRVPKVPKVPTPCWHRCRHTDCECCHATVNKLGKRASP